MDETSLRALLDDADHAIHTPPTGALVTNSLLTGRKLRHRRNQAVAVAAAVIGIAAVAVPTAYASHVTASHSLKPDHPARPISWPVAFVAEAAQIVPVQTATGTVEKPIKVQGHAAYNMAVAPDGKGYVDGYANYVVPVNLATRTTGRSIRALGAGRIVVTPNGRTAYVSAYASSSTHPSGVLPISVATNHAETLIPTPGIDSYILAVTPNSQMLYASGYTTRLTSQFTEIVPVQTATNTALKPIRLSAHGAPQTLLVTPDSKTLVVLEIGPGGVGNTVSQINVATGAVRPPVLIRARGAVSAMVLSPNGKMAYALSASSVTPVDLATNIALPAIKVPADLSSAYNLVITPNGKRLYALTARGLEPINTVSGKALAPIGVPGLDYPTGIAVNPNGQVLYVGAGHNLVPISTASDRVGSPIALGGTGFAARPWAFVFRQ